MYGPIAGNKNLTNASKRNPTKKRKRLVRHEDGIAIGANPGGSTRVQYSRRFPRVRTYSDPIFMLNLTIWWLCTIAARSGDN